LKKVYSFYWTVEKKVRNFGRQGKRYLVDSDLDNSADFLNASMSDLSLDSDLLAGETVIGNDGEGDGVEKAGLDGGVGQIRGQNLETESTDDGSNGEFELRSSSRWNHVSFHFTRNSGEDIANGSRATGNSHLSESSNSTCTEGTNGLSWS
jgi:hypothetical protein